MRYWEHFTQDRKVPESGSLFLKHHGLLTNIHPIFSHGVVSDVRVTMYGACKCDYEVKAVNEDGSCEMMWQLATLSKGQVVKSDDVVFLPRGYSVRITRVGGDNIADEFNEIRVSLQLETSS